MRLVLIAEDRVGWVTTRVLVDRVLIECGPDWIDTETVESLRDWTGLDGAAEYSKWTDLERIACARGVKVHGRSEGPDYTAARRALAVALRIGACEALDVLVLARDMDNQPKRRKGLAAARSAFEGAQPKLPFAVVIAAADPEGEAWCLNGFHPECDSEVAILEAIRRRLGFDPTRNPGRLRGDRRHDGTGPDCDIKKVLSELTGSDAERAERCLGTTPLSALVERGHASGLTEFLSEVRARILPRLDLAPARPCDVP